MFSWIIKMLLKFLKPLAKFAIAYGLIDALLNQGEEGDETEDASEEPASEG